MRVAHRWSSFVLILPALALAQDLQTGQRVYATPSGASNGWYSGCIVRDGRNNRSYQVECAGTTYWIVVDSISTTAPQPQPDPMRPGQMLIPKITASSAPPTASQDPRRPAAPVTTTAAPVVADAGEVPGNYAAATARRIAADQAAAASAVLRSGKYPCYSMGQYTFSDLIITGPHSYRVEPGGSGRFDYDKGVLTFLSGPYAGAYSRMVDGRTVGVSAKGNTNLGTQCGLE